MREYMGRRVQRVSAANGSGRPSYLQGLQALVDEEELHLHAAVCEHAKGRLQKRKAGIAGVRKGAKKEKRER